MKIYINSGHTIIDPGAVAPGKDGKLNTQDDIKESVLNREVVLYLSELLKSSGNEVKINEPQMNMAMSIKDAKNWDYDIAISIHHNSANVMGVECWIPSSGQASEIRECVSLAENILRNLKLQGFKNRGIKSTMEFGWLRQLSKIRVLVECQLLSDVSPSIVASHIYNGITEYLK